MSRRIRRMIVAAAVVLAAMVAVCYGWWYVEEYYPAPNFKVVQPGVLLRSGQPDTHALGETLENYHIRTIVNLRGEATDERWWTDEAKFCRRKGLELVNIAMSEQGREAGDLRQFLQVATDANCQPVLVHCSEGSARTGFAVAAFRIAVDKWTFDAAIEEAKRSGFHPDKPAHAAYVLILKALAGGADWRTIGLGGAACNPITGGAISCTSAPAR